MKSLCDKIKDGYKNDDEIINTGQLIQNNNDDEGDDRMHPMGHDMFGVDDQSRQVMNQVLQN